MICHDVNVQTYDLKEFNVMASPSKYDVTHRHGLLSFIVVAIDTQCQHGEV